MKGIIYKIEGYGLTYYGSTIQPLYERKANHKSQYNNRDKGRNYCSSWLILEKGDDWIIEKIEDFEFDDLDDLKLREAYYQKNNECVNIQKLKTKEELRVYKKEWAEKDRREKGCKIKAEMVLTKDPDYYARKKREARAKETPEQKEIRLAKRREQYAKKEHTEEQKEKARERARKQRENKK
jgi:hypothetical protein